MQCITYVTKMDLATMDCRGTKEEVEGVRESDKA